MHYGPCLPSIVPKRAAPSPGEICWGFPRQVNRSSRALATRRLRFSRRRHEIPGGRPTVNALTQFALLCKIAPLRARRAPMQIKLANAPVSWGVDYADDPKNPPWRQVMGEIAEAGFASPSLAPTATIRPIPRRLRQEFAAHGLAVVAGFVFQPLHDPAKKRRGARGSGAHRARFSPPSAARTS